MLSLTLLSENTTDNTIGKSPNTVLNDIKDESSFIKVSNVSDSMVKATTRLKEIEKVIEVKDNIKKIHKELSPYCEAIDLLLVNEDYKKLSTLNIRELQKMQGELAIYLKDFSAWSESFKLNIEEYDKQRKVLKEYSSLWNKTYENAVKEESPEVILEHILSVVEFIKSLEESLKDRYDNVLISSQKITVQLLKINEINKNIKVNEALIKSQIFYQNQVPLFELLSTDKFSFIAYVVSIKTTFIDKYFEAKIFFEMNIDIFYIYMLFIVFIFAFIFYFNYLYRKKTLFVLHESFNKKEYFFIKRPISTFIILADLLIVILYSNRLVPVIEMQLLVLFIPTLRILQTVIRKKNIKYIYIFFALYLVYTLEKNGAGYDLDARILLLLINIVLFISIVVSLMKKVLYNIGYNLTTKLGTYLLVLYSVLLLVAIGLNLYGSVLLSSRVIEGIFTSIYASAIFYTIYTILNGYIVVVLRRRMSSASNLLERYSHRIEKSTKMIIKIIMFGWWFVVVANILGVFTYIVSFKNTILGLSWEVSQTTISVSSIVDFIFIVVGTWAIARLSRTILEIEIFSRFTLPRGMPTAILTVLNYVIVISGTIVAFSSLGVTPQQFALVFGALGVGIGFGLRNIIANFVSGIIMVFERPVQIGDTIEVDKTMGNVQSIGARSSTIKTFDGSEVIIPNADFIAKEITNWTLSDEHRRKTVEFRVDSQSDIDLVLKIMKDMALAHPDVLRDPEPLATFKGFNEYYLEFKLYFWLSSNLIVAPSDIAISIYKSLKEEGIEMPIQQTKIKR